MDIVLGCISATTFTQTGEIDEEAFRLHLRRLIESRVTVYLGSGGNCESHSLTPDELHRIYTIAVEECRGKVLIAGHLPEESNAKAMRAQAEIAISANVDMLNIYTPEGRHSYRPTDPEVVAYYDYVLEGIKKPTAIIASRSMGYVPGAAALAEICRKHSQIVSVFLHTPDAYLLELKAMLRPGIEIHTHFMDSPLNAFAFGSRGVFMVEANTIPKTGRRFIDSYQAGKTEEMGAALADITRFNQYVRKWKGSNTRWIKMAMRVLKLPGGVGGPRPPYLLPEDDELKKFVDGLLALGIPEIDELARAAGLKI